AGCGARSAVEDDRQDAATAVVQLPEACNGLDDDLDGSVDEDFRDGIGRYVADDHCGGCDTRCRPRNPNELAVACALIDDAPSCVATSCAEGFARSSTGRCVPAWDSLCLDC